MTFGTSLDPMARLAGLPQEEGDDLGYEAGESTDSTIDDGNFMGYYALW